MKQSRAILILVAVSILLRLAGLPVSAHYVGLANFMTLLSLGAAFAAALLCCIAASKILRTHWKLQPLFHKLRCIVLFLSLPVCFFCGMRISWNRWMYGYLLLAAVFEIAALKKKL